MAELPLEGDSIGTLFPTRIPSLAVQADIDQALRLLYYGNASSGPSEAVEANLPSSSIAGRFRDLNNLKLNKTNGTVDGTFTVDNGASPTLYLQGTTYKLILTGTPDVSDKTITFPNSTGTVALTTQSTLPYLITFDDSTTSHVLTIGAGDTAVGQTRTINIGTTSAGTTNVNLGATTGTGTITSNQSFVVVGTVSATGLAGSLLSSANPLMNNAVSVGTSAIPSRQDHVHPVDTSRSPVNAPTFTGTVTIPTLDLTTASTATVATAYFVETGSDGVVRPKLLADVKTEVVTTASVNAVAATTVGTVTSGTWNATTIADAKIDAAIARLASPTFTGTVTVPTLDLTTASTATTATSYFVETGSDGVVRPKLLADVKTEVVTTATVNSAAATTVGTVTSGIWNAGAVTSSGAITGTALGGSLLSSTNPVMDSTAAPGTATVPARQDHVHPTDTSRAAASHSHAQSDVTGLVSALALLSPLANPTFTGTVTAATLDLTTAATATAATSYWVETGSDGILRPKTLANTKTEIVTTAAVNSAAATTVGTVTSGTWNASLIDGQRGGTGVANTGKSLTLGGNTTIGTHAVTFTTAGITNVTLPTSGTLEVTGHTHNYLSNSSSSTQYGYFTDVFLYDDNSHYLAITNGDDLSLNRYLTIDVNDASRTLTFSGNLTVAATATVSNTNTGDQTISLTGDVTGSGTGSFAATLANTAVSANSYGSATQVGTFTVDSKGRLTNAGNTTVTPAWGSITGKPTDLAGYNLADDALSTSTSSTQAGYFGDIYLFDDNVPSHYLQITNLGNQSAARTLSIDTNDANRTVSLSGNLTVSSTATISGTSSGTNTGDQSISLTGDASGTWSAGSITVVVNDDSHSHTGSTISALDAGDTTTGTFNIARIPTGTTGTTVSLGDHTHSYLSSLTNSTQSGYFGDVYLYDDTNPSHYLQLTNSGDQSQTRYLAFNVNDASRTLSMSGNLTVSAAATVSGTNTGDQSISLSGDASGTWSAGNITVVVSDDSHSHTGSTLSSINASTLTTGTVPYAQLPTGTTGSTVAIGNHTHSGVYQPVGNDITAIEALTGTGFAKRTGVDTWSLDTNTYVTTSGTAAVATYAEKVIISNDANLAATVYPTWVTTTTGNLPHYTSNAKLYFVPSTGVLTATTFSGSGASLSSIPQSAVTNLTSDLSGKAASSHTHAISDVTNLNSYKNKTTVGSGNTPSPAGSPSAGDVHINYTTGKVFVYA